MTGRQTGKTPAHPLETAMPTTSTFDATCAEDAGNRVGVPPSRWTHVMTREQLRARHALTASLGPDFAERERLWYEARTEGELRTAMVWAWNLAEDDTYQLARTYLALTFHKVERQQPLSS